MGGQLDSVPDEIEESVCAASFKSPLDATLVGA